MSYQVEDLRALEPPLERPAERVVTPGHTLANDFPNMQAACDHAVFDMFLAILPASSSRNLVPAVPSATGPIRDQHVSRDETGSSVSSGPPAYFKPVSRQSARHRLRDLRNIETTDRDLSKPSTLESTTAPLFSNEHFLPWNNQRMWYFFEICTYRRKHVDRTFVRQPLILVVMFAEDLVALAWGRRETGGTPRAFAVVASALGIPACLPSHPARRLNKTSCVFYFGYLWSEIGCPSGPEYDNMTLRRADSSC